MPQVTGSSGGSCAVWDLRRVDQCDPLARHDVRAVCMLLLLLPPPPLLPQEQRHLLQQQRRFLT